MGAIYGDCMLILAADTSGKNGSIALANGNADGSCEIIEIVPLEGGTFSAQLVLQTAALLAKHGFRKHDLGAFVVASGPGSFTGLRVGLAAIKALAEVMRKPVAVVSRLQAIADAGTAGTRRVAALDAGRGEIYAGAYEMDNRNAVWEGLLTAQEFLLEAKQWRVITPDHYLADLVRTAGAEVEAVEPPRADAIARLGWPDIIAGKTVSPEDVEANYLRRSDAEIFSTPTPPVGTDARRS